MKLQRYKQNLKVNENKIYSYNTNVAIINHDNKTILVPKYYSKTTTKHINYITKLLNYSQIKTF